MLDAKALELQSSAGLLELVRRLLVEQVVRRVSYPSALRDQVANSVLKDQKPPKNVVFEDGFVMAFAAPDEQVADLSSFQVSSALLL